MNVNGQTVFALFDHCSPLYGRVTVSIRPSSDEITHVSFLQTQLAALWPLRQFSCDEEADPAPVLLQASAKSSPSIQDFRFIHHPARNKPLPG